MKKTLLLISLFWTAVTLLQTNPSLAADKCQDQVSALLDHWGIPRTPILRSSVIRVYGSNENKRLADAAKHAENTTRRDIRKDKYTPAPAWISNDELNALAKRDSKFNTKLRDDAGKFSNVDPNSLWDENVKVTDHKTRIMLSRSGLKRKLHKTITNKDGKAENYYIFQKSHDLQAKFNHDCEL